MMMQKLPVYAVLALFCNRGKLVLERSLIISQDKRRGALVHLPSGPVQVPNIDADMNGAKRRFHFLYSTAFGARPYLVPCKSDEFDELMLFLPIGCVVTPEKGSSFAPLDRLFEIFLPGPNFKATIAVPGIAEELSLDIRGGVANLKSNGSKEMNLRVEFGQPSRAATFA